MSIAPCADIHPTAIVAEGAQIAKGVSIGPYSIIGPQVALGEGVTLRSHVNLEGDTQIGKGCEIYPFASIGAVPQDLKYKGEPTKLIVGENCVIREHVTMNLGTEGGGGITRVGDNCLFMAAAHVAHDCQVGNHVILANNATIAGHVEVGDFSILGGLSGVHQFVRIGPHAMIGGMAAVDNDIIPFGSVMGNRAQLAGLNIVGMKRRNFERAEIDVLRNAYRVLFKEKHGSLQERAGTLSKELPEGDSPARLVIDFVLAGGNRHFCVPKEG